MAPPKPELQKKLTRAEQRAADERKNAEIAAIATVAKITIPLVAAILAAGRAGVIDILNNGLRAINSRIAELQPFTWLDESISIGILVAVAGAFVWAIKK